jgi:hypothetical protein
VEVKPPQQKPTGTVFREKHKQFVKTDCVLTGERLAASIFGIQNRQIERVHARFATLEKGCFGIRALRHKLDAALSNQSGVRVFVCFSKTQLAPIIISDFFLIFLLSLNFVFFYSASAAGSALIIPFYPRHFRLFGFIFWKNI